MKLLYVCTDFPYPPRHGGMVDMWNRIQALHRLGIPCDVVATVAEAPSPQFRAQVESLVQNLILCRRDSGKKGVLSLRPGHVAIRSELRHVKLPQPYDLVLLQTEFTSDILRNPSLQATAAAVRVDNDEFAFHIQTAMAEKSIPLKAYFLIEALRIKWHTSKILPEMDKLWFVSHREQDKYKATAKNHSRQEIAFLPAGIDLRLLDHPPLAGQHVLFVGNLWAQMNREALEWYISKIHPLLDDVEGYKFVIAGSSRGKACHWLNKLTSAWTNISIHYDPDDLTPYYQASAIFVNPVQKGAGVKLKTIEAALRGLPVVTTNVGAEGSGLKDKTHCLFADSPAAFADAIRRLLHHKDLAGQLARNAQDFISYHYDQEKALSRLLLPGSKPAIQMPAQTAPLSL